jgi:hypothetical protein
MRALTEGHAGALAGEDEYEGGDELSERRLEGARVVHLLVAPDGDPADRHFHGLASCSNHRRRRRRRLCLEQSSGDVRCGGEEEKPWRWYIYTGAGVPRLGGPGPGAAARLSGWNARAYFLAAK